MENRFRSLDGWRGISILCVIAGHWLPLGLKSWQMNGAVASTGMAVFFTLSGFLITNLLLKDDNIRSFLIRRFMRIIPLAWLVLFITLLTNEASKHQWFSSFLFYANWPPMGLLNSTSHFWSLCLEIQFYLSIAVLVKIFRDKAFLLLPLLCVLVTGYRFINGVEMAINTYYRIDEILAGCCLALLYNSNRTIFKDLIGRTPPILLLALLIMSAHPKFGYLNYLRPYIALLLVGSTLFSTRKKWWDLYLESRVLIYIASISYALYIIHGVLGHTWLGDGNTLVKYAKRPLLFTLTLMLAHFSTYYYEVYWVKLGKKFTQK